MLTEESAFAVHLSFNGNCREAFCYYQNRFGGKLTVQTMGDTPHGSAMSKQMQKIVVWATLQNQYFRLVGTDLQGEWDLVSGNNVSILIQCNSFTERTRLINKLVGRNFCSAENNNPLINITDPFSVRWILSVN